jgi:hypothetical protein
MTDELPAYGPGVECWNCCELREETEADAFVRACNPQWDKFPYRGLCIDCCVEGDPDCRIPTMQPDGQA